MFAEKGAINGAQSPKGRAVQRQCRRVKKDSGRHTEMTGRHLNIRHLNGDARYRSTLLVDAKREMHATGRRSFVHRVDAHFCTVMSVAAMPSHRVGTITRAPKTCQDIAQNNMTCKQR